MGFFLALSFLTVIPLPRRLKMDTEALGRSMAYFPAVGFLIGLGLTGLDLSLDLFFPLSVANVLPLLSWLLFTRTLHLDGLMDTFDALLGGSSPEERLRILKDPSVGAFGVAAAISLLLLKYTALMALPSSRRIWALTLAPTISRFFVVYATFRYPYASEGGTGTAFKDHLGKKELLVATAIALAAALAARRIGLFALVFSWALTAGLARYVLRKLPGLTGDLYGAINEAVEAAVLCLFTASFDR